MKHVRQRLYSFFMVIFWSVFVTINMSCAANATGILVITNKASPIEQLSRNEVRQIFLGGTLSRKYHPANLSVGHRTRELFNTRILGLTEGRVQAYWAQLLFSGKNEESPKEFKSTYDMIHYIESSHNVIGYISTDTTVPNNIKVIYRK